MQHSVVLSSAYFAPIQYFTKLIQYNTVYIEKFDHYTKQTWRNRCQILGANGSLALSIPVIKGETKKTFTKDIRVDYSTGWQRQHFRTLQSAYENSPFFEHYIDAILPFFEKKTEFLYDMNLAILQKLIEEIELDVCLKETADYIEKDQMNDFREAIHPKAYFSKPDSNFQPERYIQVFCNKYKFVENLSILDLLFNEGPNTENILKKCII